MTGAAQSFTICASIRTGGAGGVAARLVSLAEDALKKEGIQKVFGLVFRDNDAANAFWEQQGYSLRTNLNYRNKSLNEAIPAGE